MRTTDCLNQGIKNILLKFTELFTGETDLNGCRAGL